MVFSIRTVKYRVNPSVSQWETVRQKMRREKPVTVDCCSPRWQSLTGILNFVSHRYEDILNDPRLTLCQRMNYIGVQFQSNLRQHSANKRIIITMLLNGWGLLSLHFKHYDRVYKSATWRHLVKNILQILKIRNKYTIFIGFFSNSSSFETRANADMIEFQSKIYLELSELGADPRIQVSISILLRPPIRRPSFHSLHIVVIIDRKTFIPAFITFQYLAWQEINKLLRWVWRDSCHVPCRTAFVRDPYDQRDNIHWNGIGVTSLVACWIHCLLLIRNDANRQA